MLLVLYLFPVKSFVCHPTIENIRSVLILTLLAGFEPERLLACLSVLILQDQQRWRHRALQPRSPRPLQVRPERAERADGGEPGERVRQQGRPRLRPPHLREQHVHVLLDREGGYQRLGQHGAYSA